MKCISRCFKQIKQLKTISINNQAVKIHSDNKTVTVIKQNNHTNKIKPS